MGKLTKTLFFSLFFVVAGALFTPMVTTAADLSSDYLAGNWTLESSENCGKPEFESISFKNDGTVSASRFGSTTLTGFWELNGEFLTAHVVTSPAHLDQRLLHMKGHFDYFLVNMVIVDAQPDELKIVGRIGEIMSRMDLARCK